MKKIHFLLCFAFGLFNCQTPKPNKKESILVVFAHADDETTMGSVLAKYGQTYDVQLVLATDGRYGTTAHAGIPAGDSLIAVRQLEAVCSCEKLGIKTPIFLGLQDGFGLNGRGNFYEEIPKLRTKLVNLIQETQPTKIITFGPDGDTGHPDHRLIGGLTTEILLRKNLVDQIDLYYFGWTKSQAEKYHWWELNYVNEAVLNTVISYTDMDKAKAIESIRCYKSQYTEAEMTKWAAAEKKDTINRLYFRKFVVDKTQRTTF